MSGRNIVIFRKGVSISKSSTIGEAYVTEKATLLSFKESWFRPLKISILYTLKATCMTILYADDDSDDREIFCTAIEQIDPAITITLSWNGEEALETLTNQALPPNFIFLDVNMPRMNGIECLIQLKSNNRLKDIPVFMFSTTSDNNEIKKLKLLGAEDFIPKVASFEKLTKSLHHALTKEHLTINQGQQVLLF